MTDLSHSALWDAWKAERARETRDALVLAYQPLIRQIATSMRYPDTVETQDLVAHGQFGLVDAIERFEPERGLRFEQYAHRRIWGAINDGRRGFDWATRDMRDQAKRLRRAIEAETKKLHREPTDRELAGALECPETQVRRMREAALIVDYSPENPDRQFREDSQDGGDVATRAEARGPLDPDSPENLLDVAELRDTVIAALKTVTGPEKVLLYLYYLEGQRMADIGELFGVAPSMVAKLHARAVRQVQTAMRQIGSAWS